MSIERNIEVCKQLNCTHIVKNSKIGICKCDDLWDGLWFVERGCYHDPVREAAELAHIAFLPKECPYILEHSAVKYMKEIVR